jgi:hypothetical protein
MTDDARIAAPGQETSPARCSEITRTDRDWECCHLDEHRPVSGIMCGTGRGCRQRTLSLPKTSSAQVRRLSDTRRTTALMLRCARGLPFFGTDLLAQRE